LVAGFVLNAWLGCDDVKVVEFFGTKAQEGAEDEACMGGTEAEVRAEAEAEMRVGFAIKLDFFRCGEG
jgi:hypothetical protein